MSKQRIRQFGGLVYSTDPDFKPGQQRIADMPQTVEPPLQKLMVRLDKKQRAGKSVTIISGFIGTDTDHQELGKKLKTFCGTGGSVKDGEIIVQGDNRDKVVQWLHKNSYTSTQKK